jgi:hypothetical protein
MNDSKVWEEVKSFYRERFGFAPELVDIAPILDLLRLCASGSSITSIAAFFNEPEQQLMTLFDTYLGFMGWKEDLSFSPLKLYKDMNSPDRDSFVDAVIQSQGYKLNMDFAKMYESVRIVERLERLFDETWI